MQIVDPIGMDMAAVCPLGGHIAQMWMRRGQFGMRARVSSGGTNPHGSEVGVPICSVSRQPIRPTARPIATAGAKTSPVLARYPMIRFVTRTPR